MVTRTRTLGPTVGWVRSWGTASHPHFAVASSLVMSFVQAVFVNVGV